MLRLSSRGTTRSSTSRSRRRGQRVATPGQRYARESSQGTRRHPNHPGAPISTKKPLTTVVTQTTLDEVRCTCGSVCHPSQACAVPRPAQYRHLREAGMMLVFAMRIYHCLGHSPHRISRVSRAWILVWRLACITFGMTGLRSGCICDSVLRVVSGCATSCPCGLTSEH